MPPECQLWFSQGILGKDFVAPKMSTILFLPLPTFSPPLVWQTSYLLGFSIPLSSLFSVLVSFFSFGVRKRETGRDGNKKLLCRHCFLFVRCGNDCELCDGELQTARRLYRNVTPHGLKFSICTLFDYSETFHQRIIIFSSYSSIIITFSRSKFAR